VAGNANATAIRDAFEPRRNVGAAPKNIASIFDDVANVDTNPELNPLILRHLGVTLSHPALNLDRTAHRLHDTAELGQQPISSVLDNPPTVLGDLRIEEGAQVILELGVRSFFI